jgi:hypothetical protein
LSLFILYTALSKHDRQRHKLADGTTGRRTKQGVIAMSQSKYSTFGTNVKAGEIKARQGKRGLEIWAFSRERGQALHVGTIIDQLYEKIQPVLKKPEPSFSLTQSEFAAVLEAGAAFIRIITSARDATYSISVQDFARFGKKYFNQFYGPQLRVSLDHFSPSNEVSPRSARRDNPPIEQARDIIQERIEQMSLFALNSHVGSLPKAGVSSSPARGGEDR